MCIRDRYTAAFQDRIRKWVEKGRIRYIPKASQKELALIYRNSDIFVFTSNYEISVSYTHLDVYKRQAGV